MKVSGRGQFVWVTFEGRTVAAMVGLAAPNGESAILLFEGILGGYVGMMPIAWQETGEYADLLTGRPVVVTPYPSEQEA